MRTAEEIHANVGDFVSEDLDAGAGRYDWEILKAKIKRFFRRKSKLSLPNRSHQKIRCVRDLRKVLKEWEVLHNAEPLNDVYLGKFEDQPVAIMYYKETGIKGTYHPMGLGPVEIHNNPHCLGIEFWEAE